VSNPPETFCIPLAPPPRRKVANVNEYAADAFHGRVIGSRNVLDFYGRTPGELREEFKNSLEEYLAWCAEERLIRDCTFAGNGV
jgi:hypothetical protein